MIVTIMNGTNVVLYGLVVVVLYGAGRCKTQVKRAVCKITCHLIKLIQNKRNIEDKAG